MKQLWVVVLTVLLVLAAGGTAPAAPTETGETGLVTIPTTEIAQSLSMGVSENGEIDNSQPVGEIELHRTEFSLGLGLSPNLEVTAEIPYIQFERNVVGDRHTDDVGGLRLAAKYRLLNEADGAPVSAALLGEIVLGTGRDSFPAILDRSSAWGRRETYEVMGILDKGLFTLTGDAPVTLTLNAGGLFFDKPAEFSVANQSFEFQRRFIGPNATFDNPFEFAAGLRVPLAAEIDFLGEFRGNTGIIDEVRGALPTWMFTGLRLTSASGLGVQGGADFGLSGLLEPYRFIAGITYAMPAGA
jgi:hypothetical protein